MSVPPPTEDATTVNAGSGEIAVHHRDESRHRLFNVLATVSLFTVDAAVLAGSFGLARSLYERRAEPPTPYSNDAYLLIAVLTTVLTLGSFMLGGIYTGRRGVSRWDDSIHVALRISLAILAGIALGSLAMGADLVYAREMIAYAWLLAIAGVAAAHFIHTGVVGVLRAQGIGADRLLIVGAGRTGELVLDKIRRSPQLGFDVVGVARHRPWPDGQARTRIGGVPVLGRTSDLARIVERERVDEIIVAMSGAAHEEILDVIFQVSNLPVAVRVYPDTFRLLTSDVLSISDLNGLPTVRVRTIGLRPVERAIKRALDIVISLAVLVLFAPLLLLVALLIKLTSPGPVFYVQERLGRDGRPFHVLKFRSMPVDAEARTGPVFATKDDTRPTRLGRFLRRYSIDELPQFINVLFGEMSVVGPRPERPHFVEQFSREMPVYMTRHYEKAGITGWAQVNGLRGDTSIEERTQYDLYYVENWSILFDLKIIFKTLFHIFRRDNNAY